jgi:hypothetical protein
MEASEAVAGLGHNNPPADPPLTLLEKLPIDHRKTIDRVEALAKKANDVKALVDAAEKPDADGGIAGLNDEIVEKMVEVGKEATKLDREVDDERKDTTKPLRDDVDTINGFFNTMLGRTSRIKTAFSEKVDTYITAKQDEERRQAAERARIAEEAAAAKLQEAQDAQHSVMSDVLLNEAARAEEEAQMAATAAVKAGTGPTRMATGTISQSTKFSFEILDTDKIPLESLRPYIKLADFEKFVRAFVATHKDKKPLAGVRIFPDTKTTFR